MSSRETGAAGALGGSVSEDFAESQLNIHMKIKRRQQNVFAESVEVGQVAEKTITAAMRKSDQQKQIIRSALKKNFVFATLSVEEMEKFIEYMEKEEVAAGAVIIKQGDDGNYFYVVEKGEFSFLVDGKLVGSSKEGASFGELALLYGSPRAATVQASSAATVWKLDRVTFRATLAASTARSTSSVKDSLHMVSHLLLAAGWLFGVLPSLTEMAKDASHDETRARRTGRAPQRPH